MRMTTARNFTKGRLRKPQVIWLHTMENQELPKQAVQVAKMFSSINSPKASAHFCVDDVMIVRCVDDLDTAWGVPNGNSFGLHIEMSGIAQQTKINWADKYSLGVLHNTSLVSRNWVNKFDIEIKHLSLEELIEIKNGNKTLTGFAGHVDGTKAFKNDGGHSDPGINFPYEYLLQQVKQIQK